MENIKTKYWKHVKHSQMGYKKCRQNELITVECFPPQGNICTMGHVGSSLIFEKHFKKVFFVLLLRTLLI